MRRAVLNMSGWASTTYLTRVLCSSGAPSCFLMRTSSRPCLMTSWISLNSSGCTPTPISCALQSCRVVSMMCPFLMLFCRQARSFARLLLDRCLFRSHIRFKFNESFPQLAWFQLRLWWLFKLKGYCNQGSVRLPTSQLFVYWSIHAFVVVWSRLYLKLFPSVQSRQMS